MDTLPPVYILYAHDEKMDDPLQNSVESVNMIPSRPIIFFLEYLPWDQTTITQEKYLHIQQYFYKKKLLAYYCYKM